MAKKSKISINKEADFQELDALLEEAMQDLGAKNSEIEVMLEAFDEGKDDVLLGAAADDSETGKAGEASESSAAASGESTPEQGGEDAREDA